MGNIESLAYFIPELILTATVLAVLFADVLGGEREGFDPPANFAFVGCVAAFLAHFTLYSLPSTPLFNGILIHDPFGAFFKGFFIFCTGVTTAMVIVSREVARFKKGEFCVIILCVCIGMCLVAASRDLLMIYLSLELMSLGSYVMAGFSRKIGPSEEASLKFVLYGGVSTGIMLFGISLLYGLTGGTSFEAVRSALAGAGSGIEPIAFLALLMVLVGVGYKVAMVPFHFWAPDVYEGAPTAVTAFLSVASKGTGFALLIRFFFSVFMQPAEGGWATLAPLHFDWGLTIAVLSAITMTVGNIGAYPQTNLKRLLAYSGVAHAGYLLMGVSLMTSTGVEAVIFYLVMYLFTNMTAFFVILVVSESLGTERIAGFRGLWRGAPVAAFMMTLALFSLVGLPPTAGFVGKLYLFYAVLQQKLYWLAVIGVLNSVLSLYYYARIIKAMYLETSSETEPAVHSSPLAGLILIVMAAPVLYFGVFWNPLVEYARYCAHLMQ
ncbi:MAG: NADH-quinone oxidoreductase subunit NuoN [bacterium]|nr:NADH-quinone oxidoreductase subunit NuoN [bacterium]